MTTSAGITLLSPREAAKHLRVSVGTLKAWRAANRGPAFRIRYGRAFYELADLDAFLEAQPKFTPAA